MSKIPKQQIGIVEELMAAHEPDMRPTMELDSQGNLSLDICLDCRMGMDVPGTETIN